MIAKIVKVGKKYPNQTSFGLPYYKDLRGIESRWALKDISFNIFEGEQIGIIGVNGAGKTTLLKILAGITEPTIGLIKINRKIVSLINLEAGLQPDLSGIDNIYLEAMLIGMKKNEVKQKLESIIEFGELSKFINAPVYTYSDGMKFRLSFSVSIHSDPGLMIMDESFTVGDDVFIDKVFRRLQELIKNGVSVVGASHNLELLADKCDRIIWIDNGQMKMMGNAREVINQYLVRNKSQK
jgi:ABC-type polysaccharide/polyol phosphate transport system ATPase subunit